MTVLLHAKTPKATYKSLRISYINIAGKTNVNSFEFYLANSKNDVGILPVDLTDQPHRELSLKIPVRKLKTDNQMMYSDFLKLLKENEYPNISIGIDNTPLMESFEDELSIEPVIDITIAGVTRQYRVKCNVEKFSEGKYVKGTTIIRLTDFNLEPPTKMLGLIKVKDEVSINFAILFTI